MEVRCVVCEVISIVLNVIPVTFRLKMIRHKFISGKGNKMGSPYTSQHRVFLICLRRYQHYFSLQGGYKSSDSLGSSSYYKDFASH